MISKSAWDHWQMMTARTWADLEGLYRSVGNKELDEEHLNLIDLVLELNRMIDQIQKETFCIDFIYQIAEVCDRLYQRAQEHFEREELLLKDFHRDSSEVHHEEHQKILSELEGLICDLTEGKFAINLDFKNQISVWTIEHMYVSDYEVFTPKNLAMYLYKCKDISQVEKWLPETEIREIDQYHLDITQSLLNIFHHKKDEWVNLREAMTNCFLIEETILKKYIDKANVLVHTKKHNDLLTLVNSQNSKSSLERIYQLWLSHLIMKDADHFDLTHWLKGDIELFFEKKVPSLGPEFKRFEEKIPSLMTRVNVSLKKMVDLGSDIEKMGDYLNEYKSILDVFGSIWTELFKKEEEHLSKLSQESQERHRAEHDMLYGEIEHLVLLLESNQMALVSVRQKEWQEKWVRHRLFVDVTDYVEGSF